MKPRTGLIWAGAILVGLAALALVNAPLAVVSLERAGIFVMPPPLIADGPRSPIVGRKVGDRWVVQTIAPDTYALGEPAAAPDNYEYLLVGQKRALLIDAGSTRRDIRPVLASLTTLPVTVIPTHLHFDHTNGLVNFRDIDLIDLPQTRADLDPKDGEIHLKPLQYLGQPKDSPVFKVAAWIKPGAWIDLGGRRVRLLWTPGHTTTSASFHEPASGLIFTGDYIYTTSLYVFQTDSSLSDYQATARRLLASLPAKTVIYGAHCCRNDVPPQAPYLAMSDLKDLDGALTAIRSGKAKGTGFILTRYPVNSRMTLITTYPVGNH